MNKLAYIFPGQGSQIVGMGKELSAQFQEAQNLFSAADETLGFALSELCFAGPEDRLKLTYYTQPAILTTSLALYQVMQSQQAPQPDYVAGHSLGEYTALVTAGSLRFEDAVHVVHQRGKYMEEAVPAGEGGMAAVLGGDRETIAAICEQITLNGDPVQPANLNSPAQIVISGSKEGVRKARQKLKEAKIRRVIPLEVSGPFHSDLMKPAASKLAQVLEGINIENAQIPVVTNADARPSMLGEDIEHSLIEQMFSPVLWEDSIRWMIEQGVDTLVEIGPGEVLTGLVKKIDRNVTCFSVQDQRSMQETLSALKK